MTSHPLSRTLLRPLLAVLALVFLSTVLSPAALRGAGTDADDPPRNLPAQDVSDVDTNRVERPSPATEDEPRSDSAPMVLVGQSTHLHAQETAEGVVVIFGDAIIDGHVRQDVVVIGGMLTVSGVVDGNVVNVGRGIRLENSARIQGNAIGLVGGIDQAASAHVKGQVVPMRLGTFGPDMPEWMSRTWERCVLRLRPLALSVEWVWITALVILLLYCLLGLVFPEAVERSATQLSTRGTSSLFVGLLAIPMVFAFFSILMFSLIFIPVIPFLLAAVIFGAAVGKAGLLHHWGVILLRPLGRTFPMPVTIFAGGILLCVLYLIPVVGILAWTLTTTWSFGAMVQSRFRGNKTAAAASAHGGSTTRPPSQGPQPVSPLPRNPAPTPSPLPTSLFFNPPQPEAPAPATVPSEAGSAPSVLSPLALVAVTPPPADDVVASSILPVPPPVPLPVMNEPPAPALPPAAPTPEPASSPLPTATASGPTPRPMDPPPQGSTGPVPETGSTSSRDAHPPMDVSLQSRVALMPRLWPTLLDWLILGALLHGPILDLNRWPQIVCRLLELSYFCGFYLWKGATPMGLIFGLRVVRLDGRPLDIPCVLVRGIAAALGAAMAGLGYFWCAWDPQKQTWHDKLAGTVVVKTDRVTSLV